MRLSKTPIALALTATFSVIPQALADELSQIEVITVHGDFREGDLQKTASSLSVLTEEDITLRNAQNLEEIVWATPNVNFAAGSQRARYYQIRGIGERSQFKEPINPSVGLIIDDIEFSGIGSISSTFDMAQVEVFRGPQGTRFGANALAGLIYMKSNDATEEFEGSARATVGNYGTYSAGVSLSGPASDKVNYRFSAEQYVSDGFIENTYLDREDTNNRDELSVRGKLSIEATNDLTIDLAFLYFDFDNGYDAFSLDNTRETMSDEPGFDAQETRAMSAKFTYTGIKAFDIVSILSAADSDLDYGYDEDWSYVGLHPWEYSSTDYYFRGQQTATGEVRFQSNQGYELFNGSTSWIGGVYLKSENSDLHRQYTYLDSDFYSDFDAKTLAVFGELQTHITKKIVLTTGLRYEQRDSEYKNSDDYIAKPEDDMFGGEISLSYQLNEDNMVYGSINRGYKAGSANTDGSLPDHLRTFDPEYLTSYEVGYKASFLNDEAYLRTAVFYMNRDDIQISSYRLYERPDGSSEFISYWDNASKGHNSGIEVEGAWNVSSNIEVYGGLGLLETEFSGYVDEDGVAKPKREQAHAPGYQYNLGINYFLGNNWQFNLSIDGKDEFYFSDTHDQKSDAVTLVNGSVGYIEEMWQVKLWARNMFDKDYKTRGFYFGNDPRDGYTSKPYYQYGEPAVFGVTFDYNF